MGLPASALRGGASCLSPPEASSHAIHLSAEPSVQGREKICGLKFLTEEEGMGK